MFFENEDIICEISKHMSGLELISLLKVNKVMFALRTNSMIKNKIDDFIESKVIRIQTRFRKYVDKLDFLSGISEKANISINSLNIFLEQEFCLVNKYYRTYRGDIGVLILTLLALYGDIVSIEQDNMIAIGVNNVTEEEIETLHQIVNRYLH